MGGSFTPSRAGRIGSSRFSEIRRGARGVAGFALFREAALGVIAGTTAVAAGAILALLVDTMIPEAIEVAHKFAGLVTVLGFFVAFALSKLEG